MIILGSVTVFFGLFCFFFLVDKPKSRLLRLTPETEQIVDARQRDNAVVRTREIKFSHMRESLCEPRFWLLVITSLLINFQNGALNTFSSIITAGFGFSVSEKENKRKSDIACINANNSTHCPEPQCYSFDHSLGRCGLYLHCFRDLVQPPLWPYHLSLLCLFGHHYHWPYPAPCHSDSSGQARRLVLVLGLLRGLYAYAGHCRQQRLGLYEKDLLQLGHHYWLHHWVRSVALQDRARADVLARAAPKHNSAPWIIALYSHHVLETLRVLS